jgi:hypothetical protein
MWPRPKIAEDERARLIDGNRAAKKPPLGSRWTSGLENGRVGAHIRNMKRERYEARAIGWHVVRIAPDGTESTVETWPEEKAKHRAEVLDQRAAESFEAEQQLSRKGPGK